MADDSIKLSETCFDSYAPYASEELEAYFKSTKDLHFVGLPNKYSINSMTRMQGNRYLMLAYNGDAFKSDSYCVDIDTLKAERLEMKTDAITTSSCFVQGQYILLVRHYGPLIILKDLEEIGQIEFNIKHEHCKNNQLIRGRHSQQAGHSVYVMDNDARLYRIEWKDIKDGKYRKTMVKSNVKQFYVDILLGLATLNLNNTLSLPSDTVVELKAKVDTQATWTIVTLIAECWIVCGDRDLKSDDYAIMASISRQNKVRSTLKLKLTSNGYKNQYDSREFAGIYSLHQAYVRGRRGIMLAIERDGCCHLISVAYGRMSKLQSIDSIVNVDVVEDERYRIVNCVTTTGARGVFIVSGLFWTRRISLKL